MEIKLLISFEGNAREQELIVHDEAERARFNGAVERIK